MEWIQEELRIPGYEKVVYGEERISGLKAIISVHDTTLGPACGGVRMLPYRTRDEALEDVLRLSKGMSFKSSLAGLGFGGGKSVILGDPQQKSPELFQAMGVFVESFGGRYIAAKDMNITSADLLEVRRKTSHVLGIDGVEGSSGDPSPVTARGVLRALEATAEELKGSRNLKGLKVALQGVGYVGMDLAERLHEAGGELWVTDVNPRAVKTAVERFGARAVGLEEIYDVPCDVFSPCARGAVLNPDTVARLKCRAVVGCANNQLKSDADGLELFRRGILYAPDYAVNAGGIINIFIESEGYDRNRALAKADRIYDTMKEVYRRARLEGQPPFRVADKMAEERIHAGR